MNLQRSLPAKKMRMTILPIFYKVDPSDMWKQKGIFAHPFDEYKKIFKKRWAHEEPLSIMWPILPDIMQKTDNFI